MLSLLPHGSEPMPAAHFSDPRHLSQEPVLNSREDGVPKYFFSAFGFHYPLFIYYYVFSQHSVGTRCCAGPCGFKGKSVLALGERCSGQHGGGQWVGSGDFMGSRGCEGRRHWEDRQKGERSSSYPGVRAVFTDERATEKSWEKSGWMDAGWWPGGEGGQGWLRGRQREIKPEIWPEGFISCQGGRSH